MCCVPCFAVVLCVLKRLCGAAGRVDVNVPDVIGQAVWVCCVSVSCDCVVIGLVWVVVLCVSNVFVVFRKACLRGGRAGAGTDTAPETRKENQTRENINENQETRTGNKKHSFNISRIYKQHNKNK